MDDKLSQPVKLGGPYQSALIEIRRQMKQAWVLIHAARTSLREIEQTHLVAYDLLDMAEDVIGDLEWIDRMDTLRPAVPNG